MSIKVGDKIPNVDLSYMSESGPETISTGDIFNGKKVVLVAVPGAFTPTCSMSHLPSFVEHAAEIKAKDVDTIACVSINDAFVMSSWGKDQSVGDDIMMLADSAGKFTEAIGQAVDLGRLGLGVRSQRYAMIVEDGVVTSFDLDEPVEVAEQTKADKILAKL